MAGAYHIVLETKGLEPDQRHLYDINDFPLVAGLGGGGVSPKFQWLENRLVLAIINRIVIKLGQDPRSVV